MKKPSEVAEDNLDTLICCVQMGTMFVTMWVVLWAKWDMVGMGGRVLIPLTVVASIFFGMRASNRLRSALKQIPDNP